MHLLKTPRRTASFLILVASLLFSGFWLWRSPAEEEERGGKPTFASLALTEKQCARAFPGLDREVENAMKGGAFELKREFGDIPGLIQGRVKDGKLYILSAAQDNVLHRVGAILHSLHRAIVTSPSRLPDTVFSININDIPRANSWSFARSDDHFSDDNPWLMPHFGSWSWPLEYLGPLDEALARIDESERNVRWADKIDKAVWRGTPWFNPEWSAGLRPKLLEVTEGKDWADVQAWGQGRDPENTLSIEEFCRYKYIIYAEGKTYSGRLPYHQACASIILSPPPTFVLHLTHLMRPLFSSVLLSAHQSSTPRPPPISAYPLPATQHTWPLSYPPHLANTIFVKPDWSDLEETIAYLRQNPDIGMGIATAQRELMVGGGYLSEAADACYWRALIRGWNRTVAIDGREWEAAGMRWETFSLLGKATWD